MASFRGRPVGPPPESLLQKISQPDPGDIGSDEVALIHSERLRLIADICLFLLHAASFLNHAGVLRQTATTSRTLGRTPLAVCFFSASIISRTSQI
jgi:hypothetical protein